MSVNVPHLQKPNKFRILLDGMIEHTLQIQVIADEDYSSMFDETPLEYPVGIRVSYVRHNWKTGNRLTLQSSGIWGFCGFSNDSEFIEAAHDQFADLVSEYSDIIQATESDLTSERIKRM